MQTYRFRVVRDISTEVEINAETEEEATKDAYDFANGTKIGEISNVAVELLEVIETP